MKQKQENFIVLIPYLESRRVYSLFWSGAYQIDGDKVNVGIHAIVLKTNDKNDFETILENDLENMKDAKKIDVNLRNKIELYEKVIKNLRNVDLHREIPQGLLDIVGRRVGKDLDKHEVICLSQD